MRSRSVATDHLSLRRLARATGKPDIGHFLQALALDEPRSVFRPPLWERIHGSQTNLKQASRFFVFMNPQVDDFTPLALERPWDPADKTCHRSGFQETTPMSEAVGMISRSQTSH